MIETADGKHLKLLLYPVCENGLAAEVVSQILHPTLILHLNGDKGIVVRAINVAVQVRSLT